ncbi:hypothetical protein [Candidatus Marinarcus aquaticus]|uniref:Uncharacterized protein n=1 Tax=Candidatus Marinarcus aquaticus TaxID=2044504 RepID=A0A4Q0XT99_9BACT|nr:hypothetical protein [Candidatus Marinarcus aquaticus]RXJ60572.1 hypothetical protein CRV04_00745 [Candidatus Marinarcus aquaticus]
MKKILIGLAFLASSVFAHTAIMSCFDNGDGTITCEGGFSDGSSASGVKFHILEDGKKTFETKMNEDSEVTFKKPIGSYSAVFDAGEGHQVHVKGSEITE